MADFRKLVPCESILLDRSFSGLREPGSGAALTPAQESGEIVLGTYVPGCIDMPTGARQIPVGRRIRICAKVTPI